MQTFCIQLKRHQLLGWVWWDVRAKVECGAVMTEIQVYLEQLNSDYIWANDVMSKMRSKKHSTAWLLFIQASKNSLRSKPRLSDPEFEGKISERTQMPLLTAQTTAEKTLVLSILLDAVMLFLAWTHGKSSSVTLKLNIPLVLLYFEKSFKQVVNLNWQKALAVLPSSCPANKCWRNKIICLAGKCGLVHVN